MDTEPLLELTGPTKGVVDYRGRPISRSATGGWTAALFVIGMEVAERCANAGIASNLITYLTGPLGESTAAAAAAVNTWSGMGSMLPLLGAFVADSYLGRYWTVVISSLLYLLGLAMLMLSAIMPTLYPPKCNGSADTKACPPTQFQVAIFYFSLYLVAIGQGGFKPCVEAFGADQFDESDPEECKAKSSFFNWWFFGMCSGATATTFVVNYVQDNVSWALSFGMVCVFMGLAIIVFLLGSRTYRYYPVEDKRTFAAAMKACRALISSWRISWSVKSKDDETQFVSPKSKNEAREAIFPHAADHSELWLPASEEGKAVHDVGQAEQTKDLLRLFPIWGSCLIYAVVLPQSSTFFTKQGSTLDRKIGASFQIPAASLLCFIAISIMIFIPIYDRVIVPIARKFNQTPSGITMLQRIGAGMVLMTLSMVIAALVEMKRLKTAQDFGIVDLPMATTPMRVWWLIPQYIIFGIANVFTMVGLQEFFYDQVPHALRSLGLALFMSIFGIGELVSGFLVSVIDDITRRRGESWFSDNLNRAHLDYFYWLLAGLSAAGLVIYFYLAQFYVYKKKAEITV